MVGQGISKDQVTVIGEVSRDVGMDYGRVMIRRQRFVVKRNMTTSTILEADFGVLCKPK